MATTETKTFYPGAYASAYSSFDTIIDASNPVGKGSSNTTSAYFSTIKTAGKTSYISWPFDVSAIPANATIDSVSCKMKGAYNMSATETKMQLYSGNTPKGSAVTPSSYGGEVVNTLTPGSWTRDELSLCMLRISVTVSGAYGLSTWFYGADLTVQYTYQSEKFMLKTGGTWADASRVFKKVSGIWVEQSDLSTVIEDGVRYQNSGEYVAPKKTVTIKGTGNSSKGYVTINGTKYTSAATVQVEGGTTVGITLDCDMYNLMCEVTLNGTVVHENATTNAETYYHTVDSNCTITLADNGYTGYKADIVTTGGGDLPSTPTTIPVTITGTGNSKYCFVTINGAQYASAASGIEVMPGDTIQFTVWGDASTTYVTINGTKVLTGYGSAATSYTWTIPDGFSSISIKLYDNGVSTAQITVTTGGSANVNLINFTVNGIGYQAEEGMTWGEWVASSYNTDGYVSADVYIFTQDTDSVVVSMSDYVYVNPADVISPGNAYALA